MTLRLTASYPFLPQAPTVIPNHPITLSYGIVREPQTGRETLTLSGNPGDGNYFFGLRVSAFEPSVLPVPPRATARAETTIEFAPNSVEFNPDFYAHMQECKSAEKSYFGRFAEFNPPFPIPTPGDPPFPDWAVDLLNVVSHMNPDEAAAAVTMERLRRGQEFDRLFSGPAVSPGAARLLGKLIGGR